MVNFNFESFTLNNILKTFLNNIPVTVSSYNFLIVGNTIIIPLGNNPRISESAMTDKKDITTGIPSASISSIQDGSSVLTQRTGDQVRVSTVVDNNFFRDLFGIDETNIGAIVPYNSIVNFAFQFAYENFLETDCILIDPTGIKGAGERRLKLKNFNKAFDSKSPEKLILDIQLNYEVAQPVEEPSVYEVDEDSINDILGRRSQIRDFGQKEDIIREAKRYHIDEDSINQILENGNRIKVNEAVMDLKYDIKKRQALIEDCRNIARYIIE